MTERNIEVVVTNVLMKDLAPMESVVNEEDNMIVGNIHLYRRREALRT